MPEGWAVTGLGLVHAWGQTPGAFWQRLCELKPASASTGSWSVPEAWVEAAVLPERRRRMDRLACLLDMAIRSAGTQAQGPGELGLCVSTEWGGFDTLVRFACAALERKGGGVSPFDFPNTVLNAALGHACMEARIQGPADMLAGWGSLAAAWDWLQLGRAPVVIAAGADEAGPHQVEQSVGQPPQVVAETAAALRIEANPALGAKPLARYRGWGSATERQDDRPERAFLSARAEALRRALAQAQVPAGTIDAVVWVDCSPTAMSGQAALRTVLGERAESLLELDLGTFAGQAQGAGEALGAVCACLALAKEQWPGHGTVPSLRTVLLLGSHTPGIHWAHLWTSAKEENK